MKNERRVFDSVLITTFLLGIFLPLIFTHNRETSAIEKRSLAPLPAWAWDRQTIAAFPQSFQAFFNDHFGFRENLAQVYYWLGVVMQSSTSPNVLVGKDQWLFYVAANDGNELEDYRKNDPFTPEELAEWRRTLEAKHAYLAERGITYLFVIPPSKHSIYGDYYPARFQPVGAQSRLEQLLDYMKDSDVTILDLRQPLLEAKSEGPVFFKTDTHWNDFGAATAEYALLHYLAQEYPGIQPTRYRAEDFSWDGRHSGDLAIMLSLANIVKEQNVPTLRNPLPPCERQDVEDLSNPPLIHTFIMTCPSSGPSMVVFRDSFFDSLAAYVSPHFSQTVYTHIQPDVDILAAFVERYAPDIVIEERVERNLTKPPSAPWKN